MSKTFTFKRKQIVNTAADEVFDFFSNAFNLRQVTPPQWQLDILNPYPFFMNDGVILNMKVKKFGLWLKWDSQITDWNPLKKTFTEEQLSGPFGTWVHKHTIKRVNVDITEIHDEITYTMPLGALGVFAQKVWVAPAIKKMFDYRFRRLAEWFSPIKKVPGEKRFSGQRQDNRHSSSKGHYKSKPRRKNT